MKGKRTDLSGANCGIARSLNVIGDWWSLLIVRDAIRGKQRFGEFQASLGLAKNILTVRLKKLVDNGIMRTVPEHPGSSRKIYVLTEKGASLGVVLIALWQWGEQNCFSAGEFDRVVVDKDSGEPLAVLALATKTGRKVAPGNYTTAAKSEAAGFPKNQIDQFP